MKTYTHEEWIAEAKKRFGDDVTQWVFVCPRCKTEQTIQDLIDVGVAKEDIEGYIAYSCIGRFTEDKGCDWTLGGLFRIHEVEVLIKTEKGDDHKRPTFDFGEPREEVKVPIPVSFEQKKKGKE